MVRQRLRFLVLERSLSLQFHAPLGHFRFHCRLVTPEKRNEVPNQRELRDFDLPLRRVVEQRLGFR